MFQIGDDWSFAWRCNSARMRMNMLVRSNLGDKELTIAFERDYPYHRAPPEHFISYSQLKLKGLPTNEDSLD